MFGEALQLSLTKKTEEYSNFRNKEGVHGNGI